MAISLIQKLAQEHLDPARFAHWCPRSFFHRFLLTFARFLLETGHRSGNESVGVKMTDCPQKGTPE
jgi:hypothetical protein